MRKWMRFTVVLLCIMVVLTPTMSAAGARNAVASGICGEAASWTLATDGSLEIEGSGAMYDYGTSTVVPWYRYAAEVTSVTVGEGITEIGNRAFYGCGNLALASLPVGLERIGRSAFYDCASLGTLEIPGTVTDIGAYAFRGCTSLRAVNLPDGVTGLGAYAFALDGALTSLALPEEIAAVAEGLCYGCGALNTLVVPEPVAAVENFAFSGCYGLNRVAFRGNAEQWQAVKSGLWNETLADAALICAQGDEAPVVYIVELNDTLCTVAQAQYGDGSLWAEIYNANRDVIGDDPDVILRGMVLLIP